MKKMLTIIVPLAMLVAFASVSLAADDSATQSKQELNQELNKDIDGDIAGSVSVEAQGTELQGDDSTFDDPGMNNTDSRESQSLAAKRGRQARRGQTASELSDVQKYWGDHASGKEQDDEMPDEDEDGDGTPTGN